MHSDHSVKTLEDLIKVITEHEDDDTSRMLRTLKESVWQLGASGRKYSF